LIRAKSAKYEVRSAKWAGVRNSALRTAHFALVGLGMAVLPGCTDWAGYDLDYLWDKIPGLATMRGSVVYDPYELPRLPPVNSVPLIAPNGDIPAPFSQAQLDSAAATLTNPLAGRANTTVLSRGQAVYRQQCFSCHGTDGGGSGPVVGQGKFPYAPPINSSATAGRSDGYLYAVVVAGRGLMPPYGERITELDRWALVNYVRQLQGRSGTPPPAGPVNPPDTIPGAAPIADTTGQAPQRQ